MILLHLIAFSLYTKSQDDQIKLSDFAKWFINVPGLVYFGSMIDMIAILFINFTKKLLIHFSKLNGEKPKKNLNRQRTI